MGEQAAVSGWRGLSRSTSVTMTSWRKSSYSVNGGTNCVEAGHAPGAVVVRDTTDRGGITLSVSPAAWTRFLTTLH